jgi:hypothetical protein
LQQLLYTDFDGRPADPDDVITDALDGGYAERTEGLRAILSDPGAHPMDRFLACCALAGWADPLGYEAVIQAAAAGEEVVWYGASIDRFHGLDDTFGQLAQYVGGSYHLTEERGTADLRQRAAVALIGIADRVQFDRHLTWLLGEDIVAACTEDIKAAVARGLDRLTGAEWPRFDLGMQLALLIAALVPADEQAAVDLAQRLAAADPGDRALRELSEVAALRKAL